MNTLVIQRKILIKAVVTQLLKSNYLTEIQETVGKIDAEIKFIEQRKKKTLTELTLKASPQVEAVREQFDYEIKKREEGKNGLLEQLKAITSLEEGAEVVQEEMEGPVEVRVGDDWEKVMQREIVIKDGKIIAIR